MGEELLHLRKSKPVLIAAALIWGLVGLAYAMAGNQHTAAEAVRHNLLEFSELFLFLLAAMTFINTMEDRGVFHALRSWLVGQGFSLRTLFWITGALAFWISPLADNLTTALIMGAVALSVGAGKPKFVAIACINIVVAANAGGAFSPFGDITTLMVWQKGLVPFGDFFRLLIPSLVNWLVPAVIMSLAVEKARPAPLPGKAFLQPGALQVVFLFILTIFMAVSAHNFLHLPPVLGMMGGLGLLKFYAYFHRVRHRREILNEPEDMLSESNNSENIHEARPRIPFDPFKQLERAEWDTLMFFYGVILSVGGLGVIGYLGLASTAMYGGMGATTANILVGLLSSVVDNIPVMFAVLSMNPAMSQGQWLLVTLTAGVGGSLLSIGSAAGVALMGQARSHYTFFSHLKWTWAIALGYFASIGTHFLLNRGLF
ncbi:MAG TPA: sodium:proton antiporter [Cyanobacteria bacterium UBA8530]|nr:sodium:proton antiporter [Cyanobacteria bacterium UBA8530]